MKQLALIPAGAHPLASNVISSHWATKNQDKHIFFAYCSTLAIYFFEYRVLGKNKILTDIFFVISGYSV